MGVYRCADRGDGIIFVAVAGLTAGFIAGASALALFAFFWWVLPLLLRSHGM
jgi:hypothetical protein